MIEQYARRYEQVPVFMQVTRDKFALPIVVTTTAEEMARMTGKTVSAVYKIIKRGDGQFLRIYVDAEDE